MLGLSVPWDEVKGKKKPQKSKSSGDRNDSRTGNQRGGLADRGSRGRGGRMSLVDPFHMLSDDRSRLDGITWTDQEEGVSNLFVPSAL